MSLALNRLHLIFADQLILLKYFDSVQSASVFLTSEHNFTVAAEASDSQLLKVTNIDICFLSEIYASLEIDFCSIATINQDL